MSVAIDGPAGSGKSTVARIVAERLGYIYVDTGAMYRAVALKAHRLGVSWADGPGMARVAEECCIDLLWAADGSGLRVFLEGEDVSEAIRTPSISEGASRVAAWPGVRAALLGKQRAMAENGSVVMDGRDIGTVVLPEARVKVFLTASLDERANRRCDELRQKGRTVNIESVREDIRARDEADSQRAAAPLKVAGGAEVIDTTGMSIEQVVERILALVRTAAAAGRGSRA